MRFLLRTLRFPMTITLPLLGVAWLILSAMIEEHKLNQAIQKAQIIIRPICARVAAGLLDVSPPPPACGDVTE